jgi:hypothetical protein
MRFNYYQRLSAKNKRVYDTSDAIERVDLPEAAVLQPLIAKLAAALRADQRPAVERVCQRLATGITAQLGVPPVNLKVLAVRPSNNYGELHGLYEGVEGRLKTAKITLWMRTAQRKQVVAFRSFLRTFLHEVCHHLDYEHFKLADSYHTEGFYKRESSLFHQLVPAEPATPRRAAGE